LDGGQCNKQLFFEKITGEWLVVKRETLPTLPGVSCKNIKNVTKKVLTEVTGNAIIYKSPKCGGRQNLEN
jgi:hypothetical protein